MTQHKLDLLYTLTVADIRATNPTLWNGWKDALLRELYLATSSWLAKPDSKLLDKGEYHQQTRAEIHQLIDENEIPIIALKSLEARVNPSYYQDYSANQVAWHLKVLNSLSNNALAPSTIENQTKVEIRIHENDGASEIFVYTRDRRGLFSTICQFLYEQQLSIVSATIHTLEDGYCLDTFVVLELDGSPVVSGEKYQILSELLTAKLMHTFQNSDNLSTSYKLPKKYQFFDIDTEFKFHKNDVDDILELELTTLDRPGLLAIVGKLFNQFEIRLHGAKIATFGERTEDVFLVSIHNKSIADNRDQLLQLEKTLAREFLKMNKIL